MNDRFDIKFIEFSNKQPSSSPDSDSKRRIADSTNKQFQYAEVTASNEYKGYFNLDNTFVFIVQKNLDNNATTQENVYKLQLTTTVNDKTKRIYIYYYLYRISTK